MDYSTNTAENLAKLNRKDINRMDEESYNSYFNRSTQLGRIYQVYGKFRVDNKLYDYFGTGAKRLGKINNKWEILISPCGVEFEEKPVMVDKSEFSTIMQRLKASKSLIKKFVDYKIDWESF